MTRRNDDSTEKHSVILSEQAIRDNAADDRGRPRAACVCTVNRAGPCIGKTQSTGSGRSRHIEDEKRAHTVVTEPFPHFCEEQRAEAAWMMHLSGHERVIIEFDQGGRE